MTQADDKTVMDILRGLKRGASRRSLLQGLGATGVAIGFGGALAGCGPAQPPPGGGEAPTLNFYNWDTYIGETTLADFKAATGVDVNMTLFANNDELFAKFKAGNQGYDVIVPSNEYVTRMAEAGLLLKLDQAKIPNKANLLPEFQDATFDPGRAYSMPYTWLVLGIGYRKSKMVGGAVPDSWRYLFDSRQYAGKIALLSESADLIRLGAKYKGKSVNGLTPDDIKVVEEMLLKQKSAIKAFHDDNGQDLLVSREVDIVLEYNGDMAQVISEEGGEDIGFVVPKEGSLLNSDCLCIPAGAPRPDNAHKFINYILDGEVGAKISQTIQYPTPNRAARDRMPESYKNNPVIFPPPEVLAKCEYGTFEGAEKSQMYEEAMTRIRAA